MRVCVWRARARVCVCSGGGWCTDLNLTTHVVNTRLTCSLVTAGGNLAHTAHQKYGPADWWAAHLERSECTGCMLHAPVHGSSPVHIRMYVWMYPSVRQCVVRAWTGWLLRACMHAGGTGGLVFRTCNASGKKHSRRCSSAVWAIHKRTRCSHRQHHARSCWPVGASTGKCSARHTISPNFCRETAGSIQLSNLLHVFCPVAVDPRVIPNE